MWRGGIIGVAGYVAPRHLNAIYNLRHRLVAAVDPNDSVGLLDSYGFDIAFFTEIERFERHMDKLRHDEENRIHYVSICSPNFLHDSHIRMAIRGGANVICEKPLVINPWNIDLLSELAQESQQAINVVLQLRVHPLLIELRQKVQATETIHDVVLTYITARGRWYDFSWKGDKSKSGGVAINIGIHFFDMLIWMFGAVQSFKVHLAEDRRMAGYIELERARVSWYLSIEASDLPFAVVPGKRSTYRSITIDGEDVEFTDGFTDLHTLIYQDVLNGNGFSVDDIRPATELTYGIRTAELSPIDETAHVLLRNPDLLKEQFNKGIL
jgi:UDP-N-acetyl-2-amino-2-deoxyglucuronate dehydrogenase